MEHPEKPDYCDRTIVNGVEISIAFDEKYNDFTLYFPQIQIGDESYSQDVSDSEFRISQNPDTAKKVFEKAVALAKQGKDVYQIYREANKYSRGLVEEEVEEEKPVTSQPPLRVTCESKEDAAAVLNFYGKETVNGIEISCSYDSGYHDYILTFPQIVLDERASSRDVSDQVFRISQNPATAKKVFDKALALAQQGMDVYGVYLEAKDYARQLRNEEK